MKFIWKRKKETFLSILNPLNINSREYNWSNFISNNLTIILRLEKSIILVPSDSKHSMMLQRFDWNWMKFGLQHSHAPFFCLREFLFQVKTILRDVTHKNNYLNKVLNLTRVHRQCNLSWQQQSAAKRNCQIDTNRNIKLI